MATVTNTEFLDRPTHGRIAYDVQGDGPLVLLVPGMGELRSTFRFLAPSLISSGYRVATTDLRGHGESNTAFTRYGDEATAEDIVALVRTLGAPAVIVGSSMAAGAAVIVAAEHPDLVSGLVLIGPFVREPRRRLAETLLFRALMARPWVAAAWKTYLPKLYAGKKPVDFSEYRDAAIASMKRPGYRRAFSLTTRTDHVRAGKSLAAVTAPALVVMGELDPDFSSPKAEAEWIGEALRGTVEMIPDAGHYPHAQQPENTSAAIERFLATVTHRA